MIRTYLDKALKVLRGQVGSNKGSRSALVTVTDALGPPRAPPPKRQKSQQLSGAEGFRGVAPPPHCNRPARRGRGRGGPPSKLGPEHFNSLI